MSDRWRHVANSFNDRTIDPIINFYSCHYDSNQNLVDRFIDWKIAFFHMEILECQGLDDGLKNVSIGSTECGGIHFDKMKIVKYHGYAQVKSAYEFYKALLKIQRDLFSAILAHCNNHTSSNPVILEAIQRISALHMDFLFLICDASGREIDCLMNDYTIKHLSDSVYIIKDSCLNNISSSEYIKSVCSDCLAVGLRIPDAINGNAKRLIQKINANIKLFMFLDYSKRISAYFADLNEILHDCYCGGGEYDPGCMDIPLHDKMVYRNLIEIPEILNYTKTGMALRVLLEDLNSAIRME